MHFSIAFCILVCPSLSIVNANLCLDVSFNYNVIVELLFLLLLLLLLFVLLLLFLLR